jgi:hypothetical protein
MGVGLTPAAVGTPVISVEKHAGAKDSAAVRRACPTCTAASLMTPRFSGLGSVTEPLTQNCSIECDPAGRSHVWKCSTYCSKDWLSDDAITSARRNSADHLAAMAASVF